MRRVPPAALTPLLLLLLVPSLSTAGEITGQQIVEKSSGNRTVKNSVQTMNMKIFDRQGRSRVRKITSKVKEGVDGLARSYVRFIEPADVDGVQFLTVENPKGEDDQWLYMPAGSILNRISGGSRRGSFMGSDFTFEDLSIGGDAGDGNHTLVGEVSVTVGTETLEVYKVETIPKPELSSAYTKFVSYVTKNDFMPRQIDFFDKRGEQVKRMTILKVKQEGDLLVPLLTVMENLKRGTKTEVVVEDVRTNVPEAELPDEMFTPDYLQSEG